MKNGIVNRIVGHLNNFFYHLRLRASNSRIDFLEEGYGRDHVILWPINQEARKFMKAGLKHSNGTPVEVTKKWGGYLVSFQIREQLHHSGFGLIARTGWLGTMIDTP